MSELFVHGRYNDHTVVAELLAPGGLTLGQRRRIQRVVVGASLTSRDARVAEATASAGAQLLIDPETPLLLAQQYPRDPWARLPYASSAGARLDPTVLSRIARQVVDFQVSHGATVIIPAYLYLDTLDGVLAAAQRRLWSETGAYLSSLSLSHPVIPLLAVRLGSIPTVATEWSVMMAPLVGSARDIGDGPLALALSSPRFSVDGLHTAMATWRRLSRTGKFIAWNAGHLGSVAVALGACGYQTGLAGGEGCDLPALIRRHQTPPVTGPRWYGAYVSVFKRSLTLGGVRAMLGHNQIRGSIVCPDPDCCPTGTAMVGTSRRQHAARTRLEELRLLDSIASPNWRMHHLERDATRAADLARRIDTSPALRNQRLAVQPAWYEALAHHLRAVRVTSRASA